MNNLFCFTVTIRKEVFPKRTHFGEELQVATLEQVAVLTELSGPSTSTSSSMQIINGQRTSSASITYTYVLIAEEEGEFTINPVCIIHLINTIGRWQRPMADGNSVILFPV